MTPPFQPLLLTGPAGAGGEAAPQGAPPGDDWRIYARSASDDKAGVMAILAAVDALRAEGRRPGFNLKIVFEGEEEAGLAQSRRAAAPPPRPAPSDGWIIVDGPAHQSGPPQLSLGVRGIATGEIIVYGAVRPLHSGHYGNWAPNPAMMLARAARLDEGREGRVTIAGFYDDVEPLSPAEQAAIAAAPAPDRTADGASSASARSEGGGATL